MFAVINVLEEKPKGLWRRLLFWFRQPEPTVKTYRVENDSFAVVDCYYWKHKIDFAAIEKKLGNCTRFLAKEKWEQFFPLHWQRVKEGSYQTELAKRALLYTASAAGGDRQNTGLLVFDRGARHKDSIAEFTGSFQRVKVITAREEFYRAVKQTMLEEYGVPISVDREASTGEGFQMAVCFDETLPDGNGLRVPVFSPAELGSPKISNVYGFEVQLPREFSDLLPKDIPGGRFLAALYQWNRTCGVGLLPITGCVWNGRRTTLEAVGDYVASLQRSDSSL